VSRAGRDQGRPPQNCGSQPQAPTGPKGHPATWTFWCAR